MDLQILADTAQAMVQPGKGIFASDDSPASNEKLFASVGLESTPETRLAYRSALYSADAVPRVISGVILHDETFGAEIAPGKTIAQDLTDRGVLPGIKVDGGLFDLEGFPGEKLTKGLDGLSERMEKYAAAGARFAKWRGVITIGENIPTDECIGANTYALARYARICQEHNIVPIVEPEILFEGTHTIERCAEVAAHTLDITFQTLRAFKVHLPGTVLKTSMVLPGKQSGFPIDHDAVADHTVRVLREHVPHDLGGIVFLSGGQTSRDAAINLNRINQRGPFPWGVTFSYLRSIQYPAVTYWSKNVGDVEGMHKVLDTTLGQLSDARWGKLDEEHVKDESSIVQVDKTNSY